ncbi:MAG: hypothetical protein EOQ85_16980 [Mesorhizobium sp.]|nr:MAG: hypothetical protein EOQ85_16980 [Mesorhizobium sp.]
MRFGCRNKPHQPLISSSGSRFWRRPARDITIAERDEQLRRERAEAALRIQRLQLQIDRFNRKAFGRSSEKLGQMLLELEDLETDFAASVPDFEPPIVADTDKVRVLPVRKLNPNLPRKRIVREPSCACCPGCGGDLRAMGEDSEEMLDLVAQAWQVMETVRPKYSCRTCDKIIQAPAPVKAIARGKLSYAALAHIMMAKWGYHLPFYRQVQMMAAKGVDIERSTLARSAGYAAALLDPIYSRLREIGRTRTKIHTDDTRLPILAPGTGTTHKGALWVYVAHFAKAGQGFR